MGQVSSRLRKVVNGYSHWCPGCEEMHVIPTEGGVAWSFDGNLDKPTFNPSVRIRTGSEGQEGYECCHYQLHGGELKFCGDCTHPLNGQTVPLPKLPSELKDSDHG